MYGISPTHWMPLPPPPCDTKGTVMSDECRKEFEEWLPTEKFIFVANPSDVLKKTFRDALYTAWQAAWHYRTNDIAAQNKLASVSEL